MAARTNAMCVYDFTLKHESEEEFDLVITWLESKCKKWTFQMEAGEDTGYEHWQGRISLKVKLRINELIGACRNTVFKTAHWSATSNANRDNVFYVLKDETRIDGPWSNNDEKPPYVPRQFQIDEEALYPWQRTVVASLDQWDDRNINLIVDPQGCKGKSTLCGWCDCRGLAVKLPYMKEYKDIMRMVMDQKKIGAYIIDLSRAFLKEHMREFWAGIEEIKGGYAYDDRYSFKKEWFDCPVIWVFTNKLPEKGNLSADRWKLWEIRDGELVPYLSALFADAEPDASAF